jgi:hypothetical protein
MEYYGSVLDAPMLLLHQHTQGSTNGIDVGIPDRDDNDVRITQSRRILSNTCCFFVCGPGV